MASKKDSISITYIGTSGNKTKIEVPVGSTAGDVATQQGLTPAKCTFRVNRSSADATTKLSANDIVAVTASKLDSN